MKHLLTIAGSDSSGGAGIQADLKTFAAHGTFGMSVITAVTAQNTTGVTKIQNIDADVVAAQIDAVFSDIRVDAVKVGMVSITPIIETIAEKMKVYAPRYLVVDPVMVATSGAYLLEETARRTLLEKLLPLASVITPNMMEGEVLSGMTIRSKDDMEKAAHAILDACGAAVLLKGGHLAQTADDYLLEKDGRGHGCLAVISIIQIRMERAAVYRPPLLQNWLWVTPFQKRPNLPRTMWHSALNKAFLSGMGTVPFTTLSPFMKRQGLENDAP